MSDLVGNPEDRFSHDTAPMFPVDGSEFQNSISTMYYIANKHT